MLPKWPKIYSLLFVEEEFYLTHRALSIQQKFWFAILKILCPQWYGTFQLHRHDPSHCAFGYCSGKQDTKEWYWGQQFCQREGDILV